MRRLIVTLFILLLGSASAFAQGSSGNTPVPNQTVSYAPTPSGGDDVVALQAWIDALPTNGVGYLQSGTYNICAAHLALPTDVTKRIALIGTGSTRIQALTGCASPPDEILYLNATPGGYQATYISGITWDGRCMTPQVVNLYSGHGVVFNDGLIINAKGGGGTTGSNIRIGNAAGVGRSYEHVIRSGMRFGNSNINGLTCYTTLNDYPRYNVEVLFKGTDNTFERFSAANAAYSNIYDVSGGGNVYVGTHPFNYVGDDPAFLQPYNFYISGEAKLTSVYADTAGTAGIFITGFSGGTQVIGGSYYYGLSNAVPSTVSGVVIDGAVPNVTVSDFQAHQLGASKVVVQSGAAHVSTRVVNNPGAQYSAPGASAMPQSANVYLSLGASSTGAGNLTTSGSTASGSYDILLTSLPSGSGLGAISVGNANIPDGTAILSNTNAANTITLSAPTTGTIAGATTLNFESTLQLCPIAQGGSLFVTTMVSLRNGCVYLPSTGTTNGTIYYIYAGLTNAVVTGAADNGVTTGSLAHAIRLTVNSTAGIQSGSYVVPTAVGGTVEANAGAWRAAVVDGTHVDLYGSVFTNAYTSGGELSAISLSLSTTSHSQLASGQAAGVQVKSDDSTKTLVGLARASTSNRWVDTGITPTWRRWVNSWYNPVPKLCQVSLTGTTTPTGSTSYQAIGSSTCSIVTWGTQFTPPGVVRGTIGWGFSGAASNDTAAGTCVTGLGFDSTSTVLPPTSTGTSAVGGQLFPIAATGLATTTSLTSLVTETVHSFSLNGKSPTNTCSWDASTTFYVQFPG